MEKGIMVKCRRAMAFVLAMAMVMVNILTGVGTAYAEELPEDGTEETVVSFTLEPDSLRAAIENAGISTVSTYTADPEEGDLADGEAEGGVAWLNRLGIADADGTCEALLGGAPVTELRGLNKTYSDSASMRVFYNAQEEEIVLLFINSGEEDREFQAVIGDYTTEPITVPGVVSDETGESESASESDTELAADTVPAGSTEYAAETMPENDPAYSYTEAFNYGEASPSDADAIDGEPSNEISENDPTRSLGDNIDPGNGNTMPSEENPESDPAATTAAFADTSAPVGETTSAAEEPTTATVTEEGSTAAGDETLSADPTDSGSTDPSEPSGEEDETDGENADEPMVIRAYASAISIPEAVLYSVDNNTSGNLADFLERIIVTDDSGNVVYSVKGDGSVEIDKGLENGKHYNFEMEFMERSITDKQFRYATAEELRNAGIDPIPELSGIEEDERWMYVILGAVTAPNQGIQIDLGSSIQVVNDGKAILVHFKEVPINGVNKPLFEDGPKGHVELKFDGLVSVGLGEDNWEIIPGSRISSTVKIEYAKTPVVNKMSLRMMLLERIRRFSKTRFL